MKHAQTAWTPRDGTERGWVHGIWVIRFPKHSFVETLGAEECIMQTRPWMFKALSGYAPPLKRLSLVDRACLPVIS